MLQKIGTWDMILQGLNFGADYTQNDLHELLEKGLDELEEILNKINLSDPKDIEFFKLNLARLKILFEKLERIHIRQKTKVTTQSRYFINRKVRTVYVN